MTTTTTIMFGQLFLCLDLNTLLRCAKWCLDNLFIQDPVLLAALTSITVYKILDKIYNDDDDNNKIIESVYNIDVDGGETVYLLPSHYWFWLSLILFGVGLIGIIFNDNNFLLLLFKMELMFLGINMIFLGGGIYYLHQDGFALSLLVFGVIAAESAIGLSLFFIFYLTRRTTKIDSLFLE